MKEEQNATANEQLHALRHTLAHLLGAAVLELYPDSKLTLGPAIDNGFYYDVDLTGKINDDDLPKIEAKMREILPTWTSMDRKEVSAGDAKAAFPDNEFKHELIEEYAASGLTTYTSGAGSAHEFTDLCRGGHLDNPAKEIPADAFKLDRVAGAYWRGDEKNKMLTRIYGLAFQDEGKLKEYVDMREAARARDHKKIGKELGLFVFSDLVGSGLPLWTPKGTVIRELLNDYVWELRRSKGYQKVTIPHITKKDLYETSGHWSKFADELFKIETREGHLFAMKPMNCPHHTQIFDSEPKSYRDMPQRYCETTMVYRDEQSGELSGLSRVRSITQDDAHVFCRENQIEQEMFAVWDIIDTFYKTFGFDLKVRMSRHDPEEFDKYIGTKETWEKAEKQIAAIIEKRGVADVIDGKGEAAMYGPKIDFIATDAIGRTLQVATIQLDFNLPERFKLVCTNEKGEKEQIVMIHCAIMGSIERFMSTLIEHYAGVFPVWISPIQVAIVPVKENHSEAAKTLAEKLREANVRVDIIEDNNSLGKRIHAAKSMHTPYIIVLGDKEIESGSLAIEKRDGTKEAYSAEDFIKNISIEIKERK
ncbi:MAG: threonine--tRNA ligase [Candidatus Pacebacteria bacterium]|nr:threonine--tRNA ligase [Candidatus Paceibacterota bacterium]MBP9851902.1 threonine--tRNA ligase [Candidatus Paceibacterota bacterium]